MQMLPHAYWLFKKVWRSKRGPAVANSNTAWKIHNAENARRLRAIILCAFKTKRLCWEYRRKNNGKEWHLPVIGGETLVSSISSQRCLLSSAPDLALAWRDREDIWTGLRKRARCGEVWKDDRRSFLCLFILVSWESGDDPLTAS